jgi:DNA helicase-2/ATP-dependent DNA helicase PcrA
VTIAPALRHSSYHRLMNKEQCAIVEHQQGPLLIIAGPGSGKTRSLTLLAMNLLLSEQAQPSELLLCTYTEKAVYELQDRLMQIAREVKYKQDLSSLRIGTIHGICKQLLTENSHYARIENDFTTLDQFTQQLLIFESLAEICKPVMLSFFRNRWGSPWQIARELGSSFDKIAEELLFEQLKETYANVSPASLQTNDDRFCAYLTYAYSGYQKLLERKNCLDFAHLQKCVHKMLCDPEAFPHVTKGIRYVLVDEYQDTSYIQEQILRKLASATETNNLFVVGDEDQALYRFRGATVRNILEFADKFPACKQIKLMTNYRSHQRIIDAYNTWISSTDWSNVQGHSFRTEKQVRSNHDNHTNYPAVCTITARDIYDEAEQFVELVVSLKQQGKIKDYSQVALLLRSVKLGYSAHFIEALQQRKIPYFCPRIDEYFAHEEVSLMIGCFARILGCEDTYATIDENDLFADYLGTCQEQLKKACLSHPPLLAMLLNMQEEIIKETQQPERQGKPLLDYFYRLMTVNPFLSRIKGTRTSPAQPQNLERLSCYLQAFQQYYQYMGITQQNRQKVVHDFFQRFLYLLYNHGQNQAETAQQQWPEGHVPILTIHQAKGLEFPVVVVGQLDKIFASSDHQKHRALQKYAPPPFEPANRSPEFDLRRLYYVAFSRAKALLVLMAVREPGTYLASLWRQLPSWSLRAISKMPDQEELGQHFVPQPRYGLTSHIQLYTTCPRQFQFFRAHSFAASQNSKYVAGQLVHRTLEYLHRMARDGRIAELSEQKINGIFERQVRALMQLHPLPIDAAQKARAWQQVLRYFQHNQEMLQQIAEAELQVQIDGGNYTLTGKIDLLVKTQQGMDLIDFKTQPRPDKDTGLLKQYEQQLHFYAHALEQSRGKRPDRLFLYWTIEERRENALEEIPYRAEKMQKMSADLNEIVENIQNEHFHVQIAPGAETCRCCDIRYLCRQDRVIEI